MKKNEFSYENILATNDKVNDNKRKHNLYSKSKHRFNLFLSLIE